jgi:hypothetical protein
VPAVAIFRVLVLCGEVALGVENLGDERAIAYTGKSREQFTNRDS